MRRWVRVGWRPAVAVLAGVLLLVSFPPYGWSWLAPVAVAALTVCTAGVRVRSGLGSGLLAGVVFFTPMLSWTNLHTGLVPWLLLAALQALYLAGLGGLLAWVWPVAGRSWWATAASTAVCWVAQEALRDRTPFGGFPWARLAFGQDGSPLLRLAVLGGAPLVTAAVALAGGLLAALLFAAGRAWADGGLRVVWRRPGVWGPAAAGVVLGVLAALVPLSRPAAPPVVVALVQGNVPRLGLDFNAQRRAVLDNHAAGTRRLAAEVAAGRQPRPALVVWPENSSDIDPLRSPDASVVISAAAAQVGAPILVGAVLRGPGEGRVRNVGLLWWPDRGPDLEQLYVKRHPVPFAEYVPLRRIARAVSAEVDRVRSEFVPGTRAGVIDAGALTIGDVICFEVAYDEVVRDAVRGGGGALVVQTNNATFDTAEAEQQLAMVRLRAIEHGRDAVMASTVGVSAFADADGRLVGATGFNTDAVVVHEVRPGGGRTLATRLGYWPELLLVACAAVLAGGAVVVRRRRAGGRDGA
ncbi:hypothetical protein GCM10010123_43390 [Pilimelia anulata]|uniref:Apolipoprotein N-acyltransferase n=1 Tax=Pilimelia anulata TaxID=53371 RepID=A0A8J3FCM4_9ACTN|nr:apolipoprotein N-acyltransferase [Pilimelia anulata]GGK08835.1 hypothetical protein GCM10010123_43390 [Pilimelia anulata]